MNLRSLSCFGFVALAACTQTQWPATPAENRCDAGAFPKEEMVYRTGSGEDFRQALVWAPAGAGPHDVVVDLHEYRAEPRRQAWYSGWVAEAAARNMLLVAPDAKHATWNAGAGCCGKSADENRDDVAFLSGVNAAVDATGCTSGKVLATGIGNGAMMAARWACDTDIPDGLITVGGALQLASCPSQRPIPWIHYQGADDKMYPPDGSKGTVPFASALAVMKGRNRVVEPPRHWEDGSLVCDEWSGAAPIQVCTVKGMPDLWPGASDSPLDDVSSPLRSATGGAFDWVKAAWR